MIAFLRAAITAFDAATNHRAALAGEPEGTTNSPETDISLVVPAPTGAGGWLTVPPHEAPYQVDDSEAWYLEARAQRAAKETAERENRAFRERIETLERDLYEAEKVLSAGTDGFVRQLNEFAEWQKSDKARIDTLTATVEALQGAATGLREIAEEALAAHSTVFDFGRHTNVTWEDALSERDRLRARLAPLDGADQKEGGDG